MATLHDVLDIMHAAILTDGPRAKMALLDGPVRWLTELDALANKSADVLANSLHRVLRDAGMEHSHVPIKADHATAIAYKKESNPTKTVFKHQMPPVKVI